MRCILVIPVLLLIVVACDPANFEEENGKEASLSGPPSWCENQRLLLKPHDTLSGVPIHRAESEDMLIRRVSDSLGYDICGKRSQFNLMDERDFEKDTIAFADFMVKTLNYCGGLPSIWCPPEHSILSVIADKNGMDKVTNGVINKDTIQNAVYNHYVHNPVHSFPGKQFKVISLWLPEVAPDILREKIKGIQLGYLKAADLLSFRLFNKDLCDLKQSELEEIKELFPLNFLINLEHIKVDPPRPPID